MKAGILALFICFVTSGCTAQFVSGGNRPATLTIAVSEPDRDCFWDGYRVVCRVLRPVWLPGPLYPQMPVLRQRQLRPPPPCRDRR